MKEDIEVIKTFTDDEVARMLDVHDFKTYLNARNKVIIAMFFDTAVRMSKLINLKTYYINDDNIRIYGEGGKCRYVSMSLMLRNCMNRYERIRVDTAQANY